MSKALTGLEEMIAGLMPPHKAEEYRQQCQERAGREKDAEDTIRRNCLEAMELLVTTMRHPRISSTDLERAMGCVTLAYNSAKEFDQ